MSRVLYIVVPCYNEEPVLHETAKCLDRKLQQMIDQKIISDQSRVMFVNDGSKDKTWQIIKELHKSNPRFVGITLSRNRGHQNALLAGLMTAKERADVVISMDADLQDDINVIDQMLAEHRKGAEIVYGVRSSRAKDSFFKRFTAEGFYKFMKLMGVDIVFNHADYRLTSRRVLNELEKYQEVNLFLRGIFPMIGFKTAIVYYERGERFAGESKYPLKKMLSFAWDGISSLSIKPLRIITALGFVVTFISALFFLYAVITKIFGVTVSGWTFTVCSIWLVGGVQTLSLGVIGEYIGKIYNETKARPRYIIAADLEDGQQDDNKANDDKKQKANRLDEDARF